MVTTTSHGTINTATTVAPIKRKALPLHVLFTTGIILSFVTTMLAVLVVCRDLPGMNVTTLIMSALAFGAVGGASGLLAVGYYDIVFNGSLDDRLNMPD